MQPKKNPKADLNKNRNLYFVIGLTFVTFITWQAIESKTYEKTFDYEALNVEDDDDEDIPITEQIKTPPPPPPPPPAPEVIEVVEDDPAACKRIAPGIIMMSVLRMVHQHTQTFPINYN